MLGYGETRQSFADIVSKEIESQWKKKRSLVQQQESQHGRLDADGYYICGTGDETGRHREKFSALATRKLPSRRSKNPVAASPGTWEASQYGYSDSEETDKNATLRIPLQAFQATGTERLTNRARSTMPVNHSAATSLWHVTAKEDRVHPGYTTHYIPKIPKESEEHLQRHRLQRRSRTISPSFNRNVFDSDSPEELLSEKESAISKFNESSGNAKVCELVKQNLALQREIEKLKQEIENAEEVRKKEKVTLLDSVAEKHQRRVRLIKEEFDFRLATEKEKAEHQMIEVRERERDLCQRVKELEKHQMELEIAEKLANEKARNEERRAETESKQITSLKEQISASLSTVSQFSEKNLQLMREVEQLKNTLDTKSHLETTLDNIQQQFQALQSDYNALLEKMNEKNVEIETANKKADERDRELRRISQMCQSLEERLAIERMSKDSLQSNCCDFENQIIVLKSESDALRQRHSECLEVAQSAWDEVKATRQEAGILRQQLALQEMTMERLKQFAKGLQGVASKEVLDARVGNGQHRSSDPPPTTEPGRVTQSNEHHDELRHDSIEETHHLPIWKRDVPFVKGDVPFVKGDVPFAKEDVPYAKEDVPLMKEIVPMRIKDGSKKMEEFLKDQSEGANVDRDSSGFFPRIPPHVTSWFNKHCNGAGVKRVVSPFENDSTDHRVVECQVEKRNVEELDREPSKRMISVPTQLKSSQCVPIQLNHTKCPIQGGRSVPTSPVGVENQRPTTKESGSLERHFFDSPMTPTTATTSPLAGGGGAYDVTIKSSSFNEAIERTFEWGRVSNSSECGSEQESGTVQTSSESSPYRTDKNSTSTRLVKVISQSGKCRYELQTVE